MDEAIYSADSLGNLACQHLSLSAAPLTGAPLGRGQLAVPVCMGSKWNMLRLIFRDLK